MIVAGLVVLAVAASLFLIFSDSVQVLRIGLMAALWAAVVGAIAMTRYRRESAADKAKIRDLQTVYELQLEREISARREYEAGVEARVRGEVKVEVSEMAALRAELAALRGSLEMLFDGRLPVDRVAIEAEGSRMGQLAAVPSVGAVRPPVPFAPNPAYADPGAGPTFTTPYDEPVTAEVSVVGDDDETTDAGQAPRTAPPLSRTASPSTPVTAASPSTSVTAAGTKPGAPSVSWTPAPPRPAQQPEPARQSEPAKQPEPAKQSAPTRPQPEPRVERPAGDTQDGDAAAPRRSRRRAAEDDEGAGGVAGAHSSGLTVAEIMANMQANGVDADGTRPGRRRRE